MKGEAWVLGTANQNVRRAVESLGHTLSKAISNIYEFVGEQRSPELIAVVESRYSDIEMEFLQQLYPDALIIGLPDSGREGGEDVLVERLTLEADC